MNCDNCDRDEHEAHDCLSCPEYNEQMLRLAKNN
jgi:hypothetical protein